MKKNCYNCDNLEWASGDINDPEGYVCNRKDWSNPREENEMILKMENDSYLEKAKVCFEFRSP